MKSNPAFATVPTRISRFIFIFILMLLGFFQPALAQQVTQADELIHFWIFDSSLANDTPLESIHATYSMAGTGRIEFQSALAGYPFDNSHPDWRTASMERRNAPTEINYRPMGNDNLDFAQANMRGLQIKQPFTGDGGENTVIFHLPTTGYQNVIFRFAAMDEGAADALRFDYGIGPDQSAWTTVQLTTDTAALSPSFQLYTLNFAGIAAADNNPDFRIRIRFDGSDMQAANGDRVTFNNVSLEGARLEGANRSPVIALPPEDAAIVEGEDALVYDLSTIFEDPDGDPLTFSATSSYTAGVPALVDGTLLTITPTLRGGASIRIQADDGTNPPVTARLYVLVYPAAHPLNQGPYLFLAWDPNTPENTYPPHALFVQGEQDDSDLTTELAQAYYVPHDDYGGDDLDKIGFPYSLTSRTRLSGLDEAGIAFINTGRGRDLGGFLLALDARGVNTLALDWVGGTVLPNSRVYAIRLQYRLGTSGEFQDVLLDGQPIEYLRNESADHWQRFEGIALPGELLEQPYIQLLWRYYRIEGDSGPRAQLRLDDISIAATTNPRLTVVKQGDGTGVVTSVPVGLDCGETCSVSFVPQTVISLQSAPGAFSTFGGWSGPCTNQGETCTITLESDTTITATFNKSTDAILYMPLVFNTRQGPLVINEFVASNGQTQADEDGDYSDWLEIYNRGKEPVALEGIGLSDDEDRPFRWTFPARTLEPGEFLLIWASGKDRRTAGSPLHTNFSISAEGEPLLLTHPTDGLLDLVPPIPLPRDIAYGRFPDGGNQWFVSDRPTPGSPNFAPPGIEAIAPPVFSHRGGFYPSDLVLTLSSPDPDATIYYTLDGSEPDPLNLAGTTYSYKLHYPMFPGDPYGDFYNGDYQTHLYTDPILITDRSPNEDELTFISPVFNRTHFRPVEPVAKGTVVRAIAYKPGSRPSPIQTHTFFVSPLATPESIGRYTLPVISLAIPEHLLFDYYEGIYVAGVDFDTWRQANPSVRQDFGVPANYHRRTEYTAHLEMFEAQPYTSALHQDIGLRIHGGWSRALPRKSLRLYARSPYGIDTFDYPVFGPQNGSGFSRLILRNSGQDELYTNFRDAFIQTLVRDLRFDTQAYRPVILFINGEYWGIHNLRERYDNYYLARVYGVDSNNIDFLENRYVVEEGDNLHYLAMLDYITANGVTSDEHYAHIQTQMDVDNFIDFQITHIYVQNNDWPANNTDYWRLRTNEYRPDSPYGHDGRWRWMVYDTDLSFGLELPQSYTHDTLEHATSIGSPVFGRPLMNPAWATFLLRNLLLNDDFRIAFINRFADLLNTTFLPEHALFVMDELRQGIAPEMPEHIARWNRPDSMETWEDNIKVMAEFANLRPAHQRAHIRKKFNISHDVSLTLNIAGYDAMAAPGHIQLNSLEIRPGTPGSTSSVYPWTGLYFSGIPVTLEAVPAPGYRFAGWEEFSQHTSAILTITPITDMTLTARFVPE